MQYTLGRAGQLRLFRRRVGARALPADRATGTIRAPAFPPMQTRSLIPVVEHLHVRLEAAEFDRIERIAQELLAAEPALASTAAFGSEVRTGLDDGPALLFEDHAEISLFERRGDASLQYRALLLAGEGDFVLMGALRSPAFEAYCREQLGLGAPQILTVAPAPRAARRDSIAERCARDAEALAAIVDAARRSGRLSVVPYIGAGQAWALAAKIAAHSGARVSVAAPPPRLTRRVNDKLWFAGCVRQLLGGAALPPSYHAYGPAALTGRVAALARRHARVVIKVPDSAGSAGNLVLEAASVRGLRMRVLQRRLLRLLGNLGWNSGFPLMVGVWDCAVLGSPSVQLWIPRRKDGLPQVEGVFDQVVEGSGGEFVGAVPSGVPAEWRQRLADDAMRLGVLFQRLGYFGRCSFDAVIAGEAFEGAALHWIECNGRWGGTSIPMTLANRLLGDWTRRAFMIVQRTGQSNPARDLSQSLHRLRGLLYRRASTDTGAVLLTPGGIEQGTGLHFLLLARSTDELNEQAAALQRLLGVERATT